MFAEELILPRSLRNVPAARGRRSGCALRVRLNGFRSLPLSCVDELTVVIDGGPARPSDMVLGVGEQTVTLEDAGVRDDLWWSCRDPATVSVLDGRTLAAGPHELSLELRVRIPYFPPAGPGEPWPTMYDRVARTEWIA